MSSRGDLVTGGDKVTVTAILWLGEAERGELAVEGRTDDVPALAARIVEAAREHLQ